MEKVTRVGIDLGKHVYQVCGMDGSGAVVLQRQVKAPRLMELMTRIEPCLVGVEASCGAHHWVEKLSDLGHDVRMMSPQFVRPYVKSNKSDYNDAEAICEAVSRPTMRFVPYKTKERRALQQVHRSREAMVGLRTQLSNQLRGFLGEYGIVLPQGLAVVMREVPAIASDPERDLPGEFRALLCMQHKALMQADAQVADLSAMLERESKENPLCERLRSIPGIGPMVSTALVASVATAGPSAAVVRCRLIWGWCLVSPRRAVARSCWGSEAGRPVHAGSADPRCSGGAAHGPQGRADPSQGVGIGRQASPGSERGHGGGGQQAGADRLGGAPARQEL